MTLPAPLSAPDCDLRGYDFMPLFGNRLFNSQLYTQALRRPRAGLAAMKLWWAAWQQCPAGSLPNDTQTLCRLADLSGDLRYFNKNRALILHGFVACSDGRIYHPLLCAEAKLAFSQREKDRNRKRLQRERQAVNITEPDDCPTGQNPPVPRDKITQPKNGHADVTSDRTEVSKSRKKESKSDSDSGTPRDRPWPRQRQQGSAAQVLEFPVPVDAVAAVVEVDPPPMPEVAVARVVPPVVPREPVVVLPSSVGHVVTSTSQHLRNRARGQPFIDPAPAKLSRNEQIDAVAPVWWSGRAGGVGPWQGNLPRRVPKPIAPELLAELRKRAGVVLG